VTVTHVHSDRAAGFTLVELLVSLVITSVISSFALAGFHLSNKAWTVSRDADTEGQISAAANRLSDLISKSTPSAAFDESRGIAALLFDGDQDRLTFVTLSEGYALDGGLIRANIAWQPPRADDQTDVSAGAIRFSGAVFRPNGTSPGYDEPVVLLRGVSDLRISYFGPDQDGAAHWSPQWKGRDRLPYLVSIGMDIVQQKAFRHLDLNVPIRGAIP
jgi:prepilin-type N-terminal cleavage/methylation domain-containing protein